MLRKPSRRRLPAFAAALAMCALAIPSAASAASWGPIGTGHTLTTSTLEFTAHPASGATLGWSCAQADVFVTVQSSSVLTNTTTTLAKCTGTGTAVHCIATSLATSPPWTVTGPTTSNVTFDNFHMDLMYVNKPGDPTGCTLSGMGIFTLTGVIAGGTWDAAGHQITYTNATGLTATFPTPVGPSRVTVSGTLRDDSQTLTLT
jgi:hypothetical protein